MLKFIEAHEKMLNISSHQGNTNTNHNQIPLYSWVAIIEKIDNNKYLLVIICWKPNIFAGNLIYLWIAKWRGQFVKQSGSSSKT